MASLLLSAYWDQWYAQADPAQASWHQERAAAALDLIARIALPFDAPLIDVGSGHSPLLTALLAQGYANVIAADISATALDQHRRSLPAEQAARVLWVVDDVTAPQHLVVLEPVVLWHDRGLLDGLLSPGQTAAYRRLLDHMVVARGWVVLGVRAPTAGTPPTNAGLLVQPYDAAGLAALLGPDYELQHTINEVHRTPQGQEQPHLYALFQRNETSRSGAWQRA